MVSNRTASLKAHFDSPGWEARPLLTSLNGDNSWLFSFPRPVSERETSGNVYFHVVHDPWLNGPTSYITSRLIGITLPAPANVTSGAGVEAIVQEIETAAAAAANIDTAATPTAKVNGASPVDAIFINLEEIDHLHKPTLRTFNPSIPVFAAEKAAAILRKWQHFSTVTTTKDLIPGDGNWNSLHPGSPLPEWLTLFRIPGPNWLCLATAIVFAHPSTPTTYEALIFSSHGIATTQPTLHTFLHEATPEVNVLGILHGLKESLLFGWLNTFGVSYGLQLYRETRAKYWVVSHDSKLGYGGVIARGVSDVERTLEWGLEREKDKDGEAKLEREGVNLVRVENGGVVVLS